MADKDLNKEVEKFIHLDSLAEAEKLTGESYKEDKATESLGFLMHIQKCEKMNELMEESGDTKFSETEDDYLKKVTDFGFVPLAVFPFLNDEGIEERLHVLFHYEYSILLKFDTHTWGDDGSWAKACKEVPPPSRNGGNFYYNWVPNEGEIPYGVTSSGGYVSHGKGGYSCNFDENLEPIKLPQNLEDSRPKWNFKDNEEYKDFDLRRNVWEAKCNEFFKDKTCRSIYCGYHDCREAIKFNINNLLKHGTFLKKWKEQPFLWLLTRDEYRNKEHDEYDVKELNAQKIAKLPQEVQDIIKGEY